MPYQAKKLNIKEVLILLRARREGPQYIYGLYKYFNPKWNQMQLNQIRELTYGLMTKKYLKVCIRDGNKGLPLITKGRARRFLTLTVKGRKTADFYLDLFASTTEK